MAKKAKAKVKVAKPAPVKEEKTRHRYLITDETREKIDEVILRELSMDARKSLGAIAEQLKISKTTVFLELNRLIREHQIKFVPEINISDIWQHELLYVTKRMEKREFRRLKIRNIGFGEYVCFLKFLRDKPTDDEVRKAVEDSYMPQYCGGLFGSGYDIFLYLLSRNPQELTEFSRNLQRKLKKYETEIYISPVSSSMGFFPVRQKLIEQLKISDRYKNMLEILNQDSRAQLATMGIPRERVTYLYRSLLNYGIMKRTTLYMQNPKNNFIGIIVYSVTNRELYDKKRNDIYKTMLSLPYSTGTYTFVSDTYNPYGRLIIVNANNSTKFEEIRRAYEELSNCIKINNAMIVTRNILGGIGARNFDPRYSELYETLETAGAVPKLERAKPKTKLQQEFFEIE